MPEPRSEDLTLTPNEFALVLDKTSGIVHTYCGPTNASLSAQEVPVTFDSITKRFTPTPDLSRAKQLKSLAPKGWYVILKNPAEDKDPAKIGDQPEEGKKAKLPPLRLGQKVNIPGPVSFALWPGQLSQVVQGHRLRQDEYLVARIYDGEAAKRNYPTPTADGQAAPDSSSTIPKDFTPGHLFIIQGVEDSFYIPPTGIEVVRDETVSRKDGKTQYVRSAVSLERLEYCLLRDQDGNKRYVRGPKVVFPEPTEEFITNVRSDGTTTRKFKAIELGPKNGIHVKVISEYKEEGIDTPIKAGTELFITGEDTPIYFPREEHAIIKYGDSDVNFGVAIPPGEARYVLERLKGPVRLQKGPVVFLPDPRTEIIVRRVLDPRLCALMYPGNEEALKLNERLAAAASIRADVGMPIAMAASMALYDSELESAVATNYRSLGEKAAPAGFTGDSMNRQGQYRPPRTITLDSKYEGAVTMDIHEGYAVMLVTKRGNRRVVVGPQTALLEYDEIPHVLTLSTNKPKSMDKPYRTVYLMVSNNYVTDIVDAETQDYCKVKVKLSYRLNFEGDHPEKWFSVENYVKLLCDNMRSRIRNRVRRLGIKQFYHNATDILRDLILGVPDVVDPDVVDMGGETSSDADALDVVAAIVPPKQVKKGPRPGRLFPENNLRIFDVEVLEVSLDKELQALLEKQERATIQQALDLEELQRRATFAAESKGLTSQIVLVEEEVRKLKEEAKRAKMEDEAQTQAASQEQAQAAQQVANLIAEIVRKSKQADNDLQLTLQRAQEELKQQALAAETAAIKERMEAISTDLVASLQAFGDQATIERLATAMGPQSFLGLLGGTSLADVLSNALKGTALGDKLPAALNGTGKSGSPKQLST